jgi:hypothetical protein
MKTTNKPYISNLVRIDIHKLVNEVGFWDRQIGKYHISLVPDRWGNHYFLQLFVNNVRVNKTFELSFQPHRGWLQRNGFIPYHHDTIWYVVGSNKKRYRFLYIHPTTHEIGTRDDHQAIYSQKKLKSFSRSECKRMELELFQPKDDFDAFYRKKKKERVFRACTH